MSSQEVITFQVGNYSNYVGTHYWNAQRKHIQSHIEGDNYQTTKLFRDVSTRKDCHYVPRLISFDYKFNLKALKEDGSFQEKDYNDVYSTEQTNHVVYATDPYERNSLTTDDMEIANNTEESEDVTTWSDYMTQALHENTIQLLTQCYDDGKEFKYFGVGQEEYQKLFDDVEDKLHFWTEECNSIEGFQILTDIHDGFSGISSKLVEDLNDEYNKKCILPYINWPVFNNNDHTVFHDLNIALTFQTFKNHASLFVLQGLQNDLFDSKSSVLGIPQVDYQATNLYHTSAILATSFDSTTLPWRQSSRTTSMSTLCHHISQGRWKLAGTSLGFSYMRPEENITLFDMLLNAKSLYGSCLHSLFPKSMLRDNFYPTAHTIMLQNVPEQLVLPKQIKPQALQDLGFNSNVFTHDPLNVLDVFTEQYYPCEKTASQLYYSNQELNTSSPFPKIFPNEDVSSQDLTVLSTLFTSRKFYGLLHELTTRIHKINLHKHHVVEEYGIDNDIITELVEDLTNQCRDYDHERTFNELNL